MTQTLITAKLSLCITSYSLLLYGHFIDADDLKILLNDFDKSKI